MFEQNDGMAQQAPMDAVSQTLAGRRLMVVANPRAAGGAVAQRWPEIQAAMTSLIGPFDFNMTDSPMAATRLTRQALREGYDLIASLGGDGTHNETVNGFFEADRLINPQAALAIIPCGTGGDFRKTLGYGHDIHEAIQHLVDGAPSPCDLGRMRFVRHDGTPGSRHFLNIASFGISGLVDAKVNHSPKLLRGPSAFVFGLMRAVAEFTPQAVQLNIDDRFDLQATINTVAVANGRCFGGGMMVAPHAEIDDGLFDLVIIRDMPLPQLTLNTIRLFKGRHLASPHVSHLRARTITASPVDPQEAVLIDIDGEAPGRLPASFTILPNAIKIWR